MQDYIIHECAPRFLVELFDEHLGDHYEVHSVENRVAWTFGVRYMFKSHQLS